MPQVPIRNLGSIGLVSDQHAVDLNLMAWTEGNNVRFDGRGVSRYSIFKYVDETYTYSKQPVGLLWGGGNIEGYLVTVFSDGSIEQWNNGVVTDVSATETANSGTHQITYTELGGLIYVNREHSQPLYRTDPFSGQFLTLPGWTTGDTCVSLRSFKDFLIAINCTKSGLVYPGMIKWSNACLPGAAPSDWYTDGTGGSLGGENVLNDMVGDLVDGHALAHSFIIYGDEQAWRMEYIGGNDVFGFYKLFDDAGVISKNCVVDANNRHFVFGATDIYVHDGITKQSLVDDRIKDKIYDNLDYDNRDRCFTIHNRLKSEILFCFPSKESTAAWQIGDVNGCNKAAVYNYARNTWSMIDLPSAVSSTELTLHFTPTWDDYSPDEWGLAIQKWSGWEAASPRSLVLVGTGNPTLSISAQPFFLDDAVGLQNSAPIASLYWEGKAEMRRKDMDDLGFNLYDRKWVSRVVPQAATHDDLQYIDLSIGASTTAHGPILWDIGKDFYPMLDSKYDCRVNGRYISFRVRFPAGNYGELSGFDLGIKKVAGR